jgi:hypothetical protein
MLLDEFIPLGKAPCFQTGINAKGFIILPQKWIDAVNAIIFFIKLYLCI